MDDRANDGRGARMASDGEGHGSGPMLRSARIVPMAAAKRKTLRLLWIASAILLSLPALASRVDVLHGKTRAELSTENGQFSVEPSMLNPVNATR